MSGDHNMYASGNQSDGGMTEEDEEFNRIEREAIMRKEAVKASVIGRPWIGLTDDEAEDIYRIVRPDVMKFWRLCEAKLKERNT